MPPSPSRIPANILPAQEYKYTSTPPETLLWLHQLRREQSATLSRIKKIESSLEKLCSASQAQARVQTDIHSGITSQSKIQVQVQSTWNKSHDELKATLEEAVRRIGDIQSDMDGFRKEEIARRAEWEEKFEGRFGDVLRDGLREGFERVERVMENGTRRNKRSRRNGGNGGGTTISTRISESARQWADRHPAVSRASPTPTPPPDGSSDNNAGDTAAAKLGSEPIASSTFTTPVSVQVGRKEDPGVTASQNGKSGQLMTMTQSCQNTRAEPEASSTNRHSGVGDAHVCASLSAPGGGDNPVKVGSHDTRDKEADSADRKKRKRREIPIVWPDEEDEEARLLAEIERRRLAYFTNTRYGIW